MMNINGFDSEKRIESQELKALRRQVEVVRKLLGDNTAIESLVLAVDKLGQEVKSQQKVNQLQEQLINSMIDEQKRKKNSIVFHPASPTIEAKENELLESLCDGCICSTCLLPESTCNTCRHGAERCKGCTTLDE